MQITLDWETFFSQEYSLRKLPTVLYVRHPEFKAHGLGLKIDDQPTEWLTGAAIAERLAQLPWDEVTLVGHNLLFDALILVERFGCKPHRYHDTLGAARAFLPHGVPAGLDGAAKFLGLGAKIEGALAELKGVRDPSPEQLQALGDYCIQDVELTYQIHEKLYPLMPESERYLSHVVTRMGVEAVIELDAEILEGVVAKTEAERKTKLLNAGVDYSVLSSNQQFFEHLKTLVDESDLPLKQNSKGQTIPALGKADAEWAKLKAKYPELMHVFEARENAKSNIQVTRARRYLSIAQTDRGTLPAPYSYYGAGTGRLSSASGLGIMNLPSLRISRMREALRAPEGHVLHVADSAQIELRVRLWLCDQFDVLNEMDEGRDIYTETAAQVFHKAQPDVTKNERQIGKILQLGAQFSMGWRRYQAFLATGPMGTPPMNISDEEALHAINTFRASDPRLPNTWKLMDRFISMMYQPECDFQWKGCRIMHECIILPNGMPIDYSGLRPLEDGGWSYGVNGTVKFVHPGLLLENFCQSLARIIVLDQCMDIDRNLARCVLTTHDEGVFIAPEDGADERQAQIVERMKVSPDWCPELKLNAEGGWSYCYDAK